MLVEVKNCKECPLAYDSGYEGEEYSCSKDPERRHVYLRDFQKHEDVIKFEDDKEWCPLKKEDYIIRFKK